MLAPLRGSLLWCSVLGAIWLILTLAWAWGSMDDKKAQVQATYSYLTKSEPSGGIMDVKNETLGFARIFAASMPDRTDKRDSLALAASLTGINIEFIDGFEGDKANPKAIPDSWDRNESAGTYGTWRAHMNMAQKIVHERIPSALLMEDDADWDVHIKDQLVEFARGARYVHEEEDKKTTSPYGDDWDVLWLGHCGARNIETIDQRYWVQRDDPTAVPLSQWGFPRRQPNLTPEPLNGTFNRVVYKPTRSLCMYAYAMSLRGARKYLQFQSLEQAYVSDRALNRLCSYMDAKCLVPFPTLFGSHKAAGNMAKDSDREKINSNVRKVGITGGIVFSTKLNFKQLIPFGKDVMFKSQWPKETMLKEANGTLPLPKGEGVFVKKEDYSDFPRPN